jgi:ubiquinone/menaquinone biosynthesis C-methylase UbiE
MNERIPQTTFEIISNPRKQAIYEVSEKCASERARWIELNKYFHNEDARFMSHLIPEGLRVLDLGCGTGQLLAALKPKRGVGIDFSPGMIEVALRLLPDLEFVTGDIEDPSVLATIEGPFDVIFLSDTIGSLDDCQATLISISHLCTPETRVVICYFSRLWRPFLAVAKSLRFQMPSLEQNWLAPEDIGNLLHLANFDVVKREWRQLIPHRLFGIGPLVNRFIAPLPIVRRACLRNYIVSRFDHGRVNGELKAKSASVIIPCRNEKGNIEMVIKRLPSFCLDLEIIFVEGHSKDGSLEEIRRVIAAYPDKNIKLFVQEGIGKGDAVRKGFDMASGDLLFILDADLSTPPEAIPKFYEALATGKAEFVNGSRLVYPMQKEAMRFLNLVANQIFSWLFTWLLNQRFTDTLCGTKALSRIHYMQIVANRSYFGDFDPFGDFDLIFGASKLNLKIIEIPVSYKARSYGTTQISRFRHGLMLLRMVIFAWRKLKAI